MTGDPGDGLGLAIVNHVVDQHGVKVQFLTRQLEHIIPLIQTKLLTNSRQQLAFQTINKNKKQRAHNYP